MTATVEFPTAGTFPAGENHIALALFTPPEKESDLMAQLTVRHLRGNSYCIPAPANIGLYVHDGAAVLIDSGNDKEAGRQIAKLLNDRGWELRLIVNTHSNADHIGGNAFLQGKTGCRIAATAVESAFIENPFLEPAFLFGGFPFGDLKTKFLMARPSRVTDVIPSSGKLLDTDLVYRQNLHVTI